MDLFLKLIGSLTIAGSTVVGFILLIRLISPHSISAKSRYVLGKIAVWFYLFPVALGVQWLTMLVAPPKLNAVTTSVFQSTEEILTGSQLGVVTKQAISSEVVMIMLVIWGIGVLTFSSWQIYCYRRFIKNMKQTVSPVQKDSETVNQLADLKLLLGVKGDVDLAYSSIIKSPVLVGIMKPTILLPADNKLDMDLGMVLHHELIHLKRRDLWVKMLVLVVGALHWFNPFVYLLRKDINIWSELSCDEEVVKEMSFDERKRYGETILNVMIGSRGLPVRFCASLSGDGQQLKRRLTMMLNVKKMKKHTVFITSVSILVIGIIGASTAVWAASSTPEVEKFETEQYAVETKSVSNISDSSAYNYTFGALSSTEQKSVTKEIAHYYLDEKGNVVHFTELNTPSVPFETLTAEQKKQATKEIGHYSLDIVRSITRE